MRHHRAGRPAILPWSTVVLALLVAACNFPQAAPTAPFSTDPPQPTHTSTSAPAPTPTAMATATATPAPTPVPSDLVWLAPNMGSRDYPELFTASEMWSAARSRIDVFKFYTQNVLEYPCAICGENMLATFVDAQAFQKLTEWGIAISVEVGAVKEWGCTGQEELRVARETISNIEANGGHVAILDMDEPYIGGELVANGKTCGFSMEQSADATSQFIEKVKAAYPNILVGDTEPYPYFSASELEQWIQALEERGTTLAHFHLDVDIENVRVHRRDVVGDLRELSRFLQEHRIPMGVIFTSNWTAAGNNRSYFDSTLGWIRTVNQAIGKPQHVIFQSWMGPAPSGAHEIPINLPENDSSIYSHTRLILEGLALFDR